MFTGKVNFNSIYTILLFSILVLLVLTIFLNAVLEISTNIQKSPYARFIVKGANTVYDFLKNNGVNIMKIILYFIGIFTCLACIMFLTSFVSMFIDKCLTRYINTMLFLLLSVISTLLFVSVYNDISKIYIGASYFYIYYFLLIFLMFLLIGINSIKRIVELKIENKEQVFNISSFLKILLFSCIVVVVPLYTVEFGYVTIKNYGSFLNWKDFVFGILGTYSVAFSIIALHFLALTLVFSFLYFLFKVCSMELFVIVSSFFVMIGTILIIYYWGFDFIRSRTTIFNFIPSMSLTLILYSFAVYPIIFLIFFVLNNLTFAHKNVFPLTFISMGLGWIFALPVCIIFSVVLKNKRKVAGITVVSGLLFCLFIIFRLMYSIYNDKYLSHAYFVRMIAGRYLIIMVILTGFVLLNSLNIGKKFFRISYWKFILLFVCVLLSGYTVMGLRENVKFLLIRKSEIISSGLKTLREVTDLDRDGFSVLFYGGDKSEFNTKDNPYFVDYFKVEPEKGIVRQDELFKPNSNMCTGNRPKNLDKMNLIIILLDGLRRDMIGVYGDKENLTPHLDDFARQSIVFNNAYTTSPLSVVLFNVFYSGHYANRNLTRKVSFMNIFDFLCKYGQFDSYIIPHLFKKTWLCPNRKVYSIDDQSTQNLQKQYNKYFRYSVVQFHSAIEFLDSIGKNDKFFLHIITLDTHFPFEQYWERGRFFGYDMKGIYKNHITYQDNNFGAFIEKLKERNLYDNSIIVVFADHGSELKEHGRVFHGYHLYSETVNIPFIIRIPGVTKKFIDTPFSTVDFLPTLLNLLGICPENEKFDGQDFSPLILDSSSSSSSIHNLNFKNDLIFMYDGLEDRYALLYKNRYKLIYNRTENVFELYDLTNDPKEVKSLVDENKDMFKKLKYILFDFLYKGFHIYGDVSIFKRVPD